MKTRLFKISFIVFACLMVMLAVKAAIRLMSDERKNMTDSTGISVSSAAQTTEELTEDNLPDIDNYDMWDIFRPLHEEYHAACSNFYKFTYDEPADPGDNPEMDADIRANGYEPGEVDAIFKFMHEETKEELKKSLSGYMSDTLIDSIFESYGWRLNENSYGLFVIYTPDSCDRKEYNYRSVTIEGKKDAQFIVSVDACYKDTGKTVKEYYAVSYEHGKYLLYDKFDSLPPAVNSFLDN